MTREEIVNWNARFSGDEYVFGTEPNAFLAREAARIEQGGRVLAVADGEGRNGVWLAQQGVAVHSIEGSPAAIAKAVALADKRGVPVVAAMHELKPGSILAEQVDILDWTWPIGAYESVVGIFVQFIGPDDRPRIFTAMAEALVPHGVLLLEGYALRQLEYGTGGPRSLPHLYDMALLSTGFPSLNIDEVREYDAEVDEGPQHSGMSALIDLIATAG
jgi:hypothetical protein